MVKKRGGKKGDKSKTRPGDLDYTTKRGDKDFHRKGKDVKRARRPYTGGAEGSSTVSTGGARPGASKNSGGRAVKRKKAKVGASKSTKKSTKGKENITIDGKKITFAKGGLHRSLKVPTSYTFKKSELTPLKKIKVGETFTFHGKKIKMTDKIKKQITFGLTLMGFKKR
jgi:hypothetical protein